MLATLSRAVRHDAAEAWLRALAPRGGKRPPVCGWVHPLDRPPAPGP